MMKRIVVTALILLSWVVSFGQEEFPMLSHVTEDSVYVKWVPKNFEMFASVLQNGVAVSVIRTNASSVSAADFSGAEKIIILPFSERSKNWDLQDTATDKVYTLLMGIMEGRTMEENDRKFALAMASLEASLSLEMNRKSGLLYATARQKNTGIAVQIEVKGFAPSHIIVKSAVTKSPEMANLSGEVDKKRIATIFWDAGKVNTSYLGFIVERKTDNGKFENQLEQPYVNFVTNSEREGRLASYRDEKVEQGKTYTYRVTGINYFGIRGSVSNEVKIYLPKLSNAFVNIDTVKAIGIARELTVSLQRDVENLPVQVARLQILRSKEQLKGYEVMQEIKTKPGDSIFKVNLQSDLLTGDGNYYRVYAFSPDNDTAYSNPYYFFTLDQQPPGKTENLQGIIDSSGVVTLSWTAPKDTDLQGYRVFRSNSLNEEFVEKTTKFHTDLKYSDTLNLNSLTNEIYYFVVAVDKNYNNGAVSDTILVEKPDTIAPALPFLIHLKHKNGKVLIEWQNSVSDDVVSSALVRVSAGKQDTILTWRNTEFSTFTDSTMILPSENNYFLTVSDKSRNISRSAMRNIYVEPGYRPAVSNLKASVNRSDKYIQLSWDQPKNDIFQYFIYRKKGDGSMQLIQTLEASKSNARFIDKNLNISNTYEYIVQYQSQDGFRSLKSEIVKVKY